MNEIKELRDELVKLREEAQELHRKISDREGRLIALMRL